MSKDQLQNRIERSELKVLTIKRRMTKQGHQAFTIYFKLINMVHVLLGRCMLFIGTTGCCNCFLLTQTTEVVGCFL
jgi:hypothetical protein